MQITIPQVVGLAGDTAKSVFRGECAPGPVSPEHCEVQHMGVEIAAGQAGQLRFWTADRWSSLFVMLVSMLQLKSVRQRLATCICIHSDSHVSYESSRGHNHSCMTARAARTVAGT